MPLAHCPAASPWTNPFSTLLPGLVYKTQLSHRPCSRLARPLFPRHSTLGACAQVIPSAWAGCPDNSFCKSQLKCRPLPQTPGPLPQHFVTPPNGNYRGVSASPYRRGRNCILVNFVPDNAWPYRWDLRNTIGNDLSKVTGLLEV